MVLLQLCAIAGVLLKFWCNCGAILLQLCCNFSAIAVATWRDLPPAFWDSKLAKLIVIGRALSGSATGRRP
jgi:hypothetical protein